MDRGMRTRSPRLNFLAKTTLLCLISVSVSHSSGVSSEKHEVKKFAPDIFDTQWIQEDVADAPIEKQRKIDYREQRILNMDRKRKSSYNEVIQDQPESIRLSGKFDNPKSSAQAFPCPDAEDILPCFCREIGYQLEMQCSRVSSQDELKSVFLQDFPSKKFTSLTISESPNLQTLGDIFNGVSFEYVYIEHTGLQFVSEYFLVDSLDTLVILEIIDSKITTKTFPFLSLEAYTNLARLYIRGTDLTYLPILRSDSITELEIHLDPIVEIEPGALQGLPNLYTFYLGGNLLKNLSPGLTSNLPGLFSIRFDYNNITRIEAGVFDFTDTFFSIGLPHNKISVVDPGAFVVPQMSFNGTGPYYAGVDLSYNQLTTLDEEVWWEIFPYLHSIDFSNNPLTCGCDLAWLILNDDYFSKVTRDATCSDGTLLVDLDPREYELFC